MGLVRKKILLEPCTGIYKDKGSKFIAFAFQVHNETQIAAHLNQLKKEHKGARHWCYAWRLGESGEFQRANDDGEPAGSAGRPIAQVIDQYELSNILVVVVRYFGGILLGQRGLIDAYSGATQSALSTALLGPMPVIREIEISFPYQLTADVQRILNESTLKPTLSHYHEHSIEMHFSADINLIESAKTAFTGLFGLEIHEKDTG